MGGMVMGKYDDRQKKVLQHWNKLETFQMKIWKTVLDNVYTCDGFFKECASLKKPIP